MVFEFLPHTLQRVELYGGDEVQLELVGFFKTLEKQASVFVINFLFSFHGSLGWGLK